MKVRPLKVVVVGACHVDRKARAGASLIGGASNPVTLDSCFGGVARNLAENLCRLGVEVELLTRLGHDGDGDALVAHLEELPLGLGGLSRSEQAPTAFHLIALQPDGEMLVAVADMRIYDEITPALLRALPESLWTADAILADCNLPAETLAFLAGLRRAERRFAVCGVSPAKVLRARPCLGACDLLCLNRGEAAALLGQATGDVEPPEMAQALCAFGVREVVLTLGAAGICLAAQGELLNLASQQGNLRDVTGAGDALAATFLEARLRGLDLATAGRRALTAARLTVESDHSVSPELTPQRLEELAS